MLSDAQDRGSRSSLLRGLNLVGLLTLSWSLTPINDRCGQPVIRQRETRSIGSGLTAMEAGTYVRA